VELQGLFIDRAEGPLWMAAPPLYRTNPATPLDLTPHLFLSSSVLKCPRGLRLIFTKFCSIRDFNPPFRNFSSRHSSKDGKGKVRTVIRIQPLRDKDGSCIRRVLMGVILGL
jgi:hypothetical protein